MFHTSLAWSPFAELDGRPSKTSESGSTAAGPAASTPPPPPRRAAPQTIGPGPSAQVLPGAKLRPGHGCCPCRRQSESRSQSAPLSAFYVKSWITAEVPRGEWHARACAYDVVISESRLSGSESRRRLSESRLSVSLSRDSPRHDSLSHGSRGTTLRVTTLRVTTLRVTTHRVTAESLCVANLRAAISESLARLTESRLSPSYGSPSHGSPSAGGAGRRHCGDGGGNRRKPAPAGSTVGSAGFRPLAGSDGIRVPSLSRQAPPQGNP